MLKFFKKKAKGDSKSHSIDFNEHYTWGRQLGKGAFSVVREATNIKTQEKVAIKVISKKFLPSKDLKLLEREIEIMKKLQHKNIVSLIDVFESSEEIYIIMELVTGGELFDHIVQRGSYSEKDASILIKQLCESVDFLHKHGVAHRDLKPQNLLCTPDGMTIKIADFGLSKIFEGQELTTACGTPDYVAPEILLCKPYNHSVDVWAVGIISYILLCGFTPFFAETHKELFEKILHSGFDFPAPEWTDISDEAKDFIGLLLIKDPEKRFTTEKALAHPWLSGKASNKKLSRMDSFKTLLQDYNSRRRTKKDEASSSEEILFSEGLSKLS